jgi:hypothetical protein
MTYDVAQKRRNQKEQSLIKIRRLWLTTVVIGMLIAVPNVHAHRPEPGNDVGVTVIPNPSTSFAYYREITAQGQTHIYQFHAEAGQFFHAGINIPQIKRLEDYGVTMALVGPGLAPIPEEQLSFYGGIEGHDHDDVPHSSVQPPPALMADIQVGAIGGLVLESEKGEDFYEPFTQTRYWGRQTVELDLPQSGTYHLLIWNPEGKLGKYVLDTGTEEVFGPDDMLRFPIWWLNTRVYFEQMPRILSLLMSLLAGMVGLVVYRRR